MAQQVNSFGFQTKAGDSDTNTHKFMIPLSFEMVMESNNDWSSWNRENGFGMTDTSQDLGTSLSLIRQPKNVPIVFPRAVVFNGFTCQVGISDTEITAVNLKLIKYDVFGTAYNAAQIGSDIVVSTSSTSEGYELTKLDVDENFAVDEGLGLVFFPTGTLTTDRAIYVTITMEFTYQ